MKKWERFIYSYFYKVLYTFMIQLKQPHHYFTKKNCTHCIYLYINSHCEKKGRNKFAIYCTQVIHANKPLIKREYQANKREKFRPEKLPTGVFSLTVGYQSTFVYWQRPTLSGCRLILSHPPPPPSFRHLT